MKKTLVVAAGLAVLSTSAFATKSRMTALNQNAGQGSYYIDDERNVFRTAGAFSGNYVYMEHGSNGASGDAEGGFFREGSSMHYGLYLNSSEHGQLASAAAGAVAPGRLDVFLKGNTGVNWGVRLGYETVTRDASSEDGSGFDLSLNGEVAGANVWLSYTPETDALTSAGTKVASDMQVGATYDYGDHTLFFEYDSDGNNDGDDASTRITVGAARTMSSDTGMFFYDISFNQTTDELHATLGKGDRMYIPVTFGFETQATSWLTWRASIQQSLHGAHEADSNGNETSARTTTLGVGASLTWGALRVDGSVSNANTAAGAGTLGTNGFMSNVSAVYNF